MQIRSPNFTRLERQRGQIKTQFTSMRDNTSNGLSGYMELEKKAAKGDEEAEGKRPGTPKHFVVHVELTAGAG